MLLLQTLLSNYEHLSFLQYIISPKLLVVSCTCALSVIKNKAGSLLCLLVVLVFICFLFSFFFFFTLDLKTCSVAQEPWHEICEVTCPERWICWAEQKSESSSL